MQRVPIESSSIASIGYAPQERVLELELRQSGEVYQYFGGPAEEYTAFLAADSKGTYVNQQLKSRGYRYQRLPSSPKQLPTLTLIRVCKCRLTLYVDTYSSTRADAVNAASTERLRRYCNIRRSTPGSDDPHRCQ